ncbi:helix-turn-helix transcriptional regulator [Nocardiopsis sp. NRRL B-16309]|uniref:helix-turn-helix domain-containing protein n=1 Tax=Nocardiopsis sp. NRRL B-16309 TaxID=1519494 RepID=UPI0006BF5CFB|nr:helix-turn-helix transcriptional regulator [Nocardiopsis sp. NRRL B-16309]KOX07842.1 hypothetical protein ADL05_27940 [Nocardiopsis sp. NRRL B-16309]
MAQRFPQHLTKLRTLSGLSQRQLASRARVSPSACCRWEKGEVAPRRGHVETLDRVLGAEGRLIQTWQRDTAGGTLPPWMQDLQRLQEEATLIESISPGLVNGLLQSESYARFVFRHGQPLMTGEEISRLVAARCQRYDRLRRKNDPDVTAVFPQTALTCVAEEIRVEQAEHLLSLLEGGKVRVHIVPEGSLLVGVIAPLFMVRLFDGSRAASSDMNTGIVMHEDDGEPNGFERLSELVKRAMGAALPVDQSVRMLKEMI